MKNLKKHIKGTCRDSWIQCRDQNFQIIAIGEEESQVSGIDKIFNNIIDKINKNKKLDQTKESQIHSDIRNTQSAK